MAGHQDSRITSTSASHTSSQNQLMSLMPETEPDHFCFDFLSIHKHRLEPLLFASPTATSDLHMDQDYFFLFSFFSFLNVD